MSRFPFIPNLSWVIGFVFIVGAGGCTGRGITYRFDSPPKPDVVAIRGLPAGCTVFEMVDRVDGDCAAGDDVFVIVKDGKGATYSAYKVSVRDGVAVLYRAGLPLPESKSFHWNRFETTGMSPGQHATACLATACSCLGGGIAHTSDRWGYDAQRWLACDEDVQVVASYQYLERKSHTLEGHGITEWTSSSSGLTLKFAVGEDVVGIAEAHGYLELSTRSNMRRIRYCLLADGNVLGCTPDKPNPAQPMTNMFFYDLATRQSWGAEMKCDKHPYNDFTVTGEGALAVLLAGKAEELRFVVYDTRELVKAIKLYRAVQ